MKNSLFRFENGQIHDCSNETCELLNPCLEILLKYEDLDNIVAKTEEIFFNGLKSINKSLPLGLFGWASAHHVFQLLSVEFIQELSKKIKEIDPETIIEVGAGEGLLGKYLSKELGKDIILTDDYSWWEREDVKINNENVIRMDYKNAIREYKPEFIIASWIPYRKWWTRNFRKCESVKGYILIGEGLGGCTGSELDWKTKWIRCDCDDVEKFGICRSDHNFCRDIPIRHTNVTYFERP